MSQHCPCEPDPARVPTPSTRRRPSAGSSARRSLAQLAAWSLPSTILVVMPKCPACLAAYIALGTGVGLSAATASYLRTSAIILCAVALSYLATRHLRRLLARSLQSRRTARTTE